MDFLDLLFRPLFALTGLTPTDHVVGVGLLALFAAAVSEATVMVLAIANRHRVANLHDTLFAPATAPTADDAAPPDARHPASSDRDPDDSDGPEPPAEEDFPSSTGDGSAPGTVAATEPAPVSPSPRDANRAMAQAFLVRLVGTGGSLWPAFFVAGWLQGELGATPLPVFDVETTYVPVFLAVYFVGRLVFQPVGSRVEALRTVRAQLTAITRLASQPPDRSA